MAVGIKKKMSTASFETRTQNKLSGKTLFAFAKSVPLQEYLLLPCKRIRESL